MDTTSKFFLKSLTVWGVILGLVCQGIQYLTGVNLADQVSPLEAALTHLVNALPALAAPIGQVAAVIMVIVGRFRAKQPLHVLTPAASPEIPRGLSLVFLAALGTALLLGGVSACSTTSAPGSGTGSATAGFLSAAERTAWNFANQYEHANTGGVLTKEAAATILALTKSDPKTTQEVLISTALLDKVIAVGVAAHNAGASPSGVQGAQTAALSDPGVIQAAATAPATSL